MVASIVAVQTVSASRTLVIQDSVVPIPPVPLSQTVLLALTVFRVRSALLVLAVGETFAWDRVRPVHEGHCLVVTPPGGTQVDLRLYETMLSTSQNPLWVSFILHYLWLHSHCLYCHLRKSYAVYSGHL